MEKEADQEQKTGEDSKIVLASEILPDTLIIAPLLQRPLFPGIVLPLIFPDGKYLKSVQHAAGTSHKIIGLVMAEPPKDREIGSRDMVKIGVAAKILKEIEVENSIQFLLAVMHRIKIDRFIEEDPHIVARVQHHKAGWDNNDTEIKAMASSIIVSLKELQAGNYLFNEQIKSLLSASNIDEPGRLADFSSMLTSASKEKLQEVLECFDIKDRMRKVLLLLKEEANLAKIRDKINKQIEEKISVNQREFFLREQLKAIQKELGMHKDEKTVELDKFREKIKKLKISDETRERITEEMDKLEHLDPHSPEYSVSRNYLDWLTSLPWNIYTEDNLNIKNAQKTLDHDHYGLDDVKKRIIEFIGVNKLKGSLDGSILCFVGPPGVGKTSLGMAIANTLARKFYRFSLGGMRDEAEIKGHRRTYIGAMPGKIMQALRWCKSANPVIMLDEVDKIGISYQGDPASALLEVLDPEQNHEFQDHYCDVKFDLSKILFIVTANVLDTIPPALMDRMETMRLSGYIMEEKLHIAKRYIVGRQLKGHGLKKGQVKFTDAAIKNIITGYAREAGVRNMEREIKNILRKCATQIAQKPKKQFTIKPGEVEKFLGKPKYSDDPLMKKGIPGVVMGLAWTAIGGTTLYIESIYTGGKTTKRTKDGEKENVEPATPKGFKQTGQLGNVMVESSAIAYSYISSIAPQKYNVPPDWYSSRFIHLHVPAGATPKDGPSAGVTMAASLLSLAVNKIVKPHLAMTGELTLTGRVLPIGGVKEKTIAAKRAGVKTIIFPAENKKDFEEIPGNVRKGLKAHFVQEFPEVARIALGI
ncbi:MAG: endopeptidase La [bacterium]